MTRRLWTGRSSSEFARTQPVRPFVPGYNFLDGAYKLRPLAAAPAATGVYTRRLSESGPLPYAFVASSP